MKLRVGPYLYHVRVVPGYIRHEGRDRLGLCDHEAHELLISDVPGAAQRVQIVCHEYLEAWLHHFGQHLVDHPAKDAICDLMGMAMTQFSLDFIHTIRQMDRDQIEAMIDDDAFERQHAAPVDRDIASPRTPAAMRMREDVACGITDDEDVWRVRIYEAAPDKPSHHAAVADRFQHA